MIVRTIDVIALDQSFPINYQELKRFNFVNNLSSRYSINTEVARHNFNIDDYAKRLISKQADSDTKDQYANYPIRTKESSERTTISTDEFSATESESNYSDCMKVEGTRDDNRMFSFSMDVSDVSIILPEN